MPNFSDRIDSVRAVLSIVSKRSRARWIESKLSCVAYLQAKPLCWFPRPSLSLVSLYCPLPHPTPLSGSHASDSPVIWLVRGSASVLSVTTTSACGSCLPNAVSSELYSLAPEQAKSKHCSLWLKGHLSRGGIPASPPKSINRAGLLSYAAAHCHGNAPSEQGSGLNPSPSHLRSCFLGLRDGLCILTAY